MKWKTIKLTEDNVGESIYDLGVRRIYETLGNQEP